MSRAPSPPRLFLATELGRATAEFGAFVVTAPLLRRAPRGDGGPVLVLPGFMADDRSTLALRRLLGGLGYEVHGWHLGRNIGPTERIVDGMTRLLGRLAARPGVPVRLVGWSLGGMYSRALAHRHPDLVRQVVTLGSPFRVDPPLHSHATRRFARLAPRHVDPARLPPPESDRLPLAVPSTAIYSRTDGIVAWRSCLQATGPQAENIEVMGSHCGLGHHPAAVWAVADRLAQPDGAWAPFDPPPTLRHLYPRPAVWTPEGTRPGRSRAR